MRNPNKVSMPKLPKKTMSKIAMPSLAKITTPKLSKISIGPKTAKDYGMLGIDDILKEKRLKKNLPKGMKRGY